MEVVNNVCVDVKYAGFGKFKFTVSIQGSSHNFIITHEALTYLSGKSELAPDQLKNVLLANHDRFLSFVTAPLSGTSNSEPIFITKGMLNDNS